MLHIEKTSWLTDVSVSSLAELYGLDSDGLTLLVDGVNRTYELKSSDTTYYLRLSPISARPISEVEQELDVLRRIPASDCFDVARAVEARSGVAGHRYLHSGREWVGCLFVGAEGRLLQEDGADLRRFGASLSHLHVATSALRGMPQRFDAEGTIRDGLAAVQAAAGQCDALLECCLALGERLDEIRRILKRCPHGLCHGDALLINARVLEDKVCFFDFERCMFGPQLFDLATLAGWLWTSECADVKESWAAFAGGYDRVRGIEAAELHALPVLIGLNEMRTFTFLLGNGLLSEELWEHCKTMAVRTITACVTGAISADLGVRTRV